MMTRLALASLLWLIAVVPASAQWTYVGFEQLTIDNTSGGVAMTSTKITPGGLPMATQAFCSSETADIRWTVDGTAPTTSVGTVLTSGSTLPTLNGHDLLVKFRAIRTGGSSATLNCTYFAGGTLTAPLSASGGGGGGGGASSSVSIVQGGNTAAVNASNQLSVTCANCSGSGVSVLEDAASANGDAGTPAYTVRNNTLTAATSADGDYQPQKSTGAGALYIAPTFGDTVASTGTGASGAQTQRVVTATDSTIGTVTSVTAVTSLTGFNSTTMTLNTGNAGAGSPRVVLATDQPALPGLGIYVEDAPETAGGNLAMAGTVRRDTAASSAGASGDNATVNTDALGKLWITGTYLEDAAHADGDKALFVASVRRDTTPSSSAGTAGDYAAINTDGNGRLYTNTTLYSAAGTELTPATDKAEDSAHTDGDTGPVPMTRRIDTPASSAGTSGDYATMNTSAEGALYITPMATGASGAGASGCAIVSAASTNATNCKNAAGNVYGMYVVNTTTTVYYLRTYNTSSSPTCSSATGFIQSWPIPPAAASGQAGGFSFSFPTGRAFSTGISYCLTAGAGSTDNTNAATGVFGELLYK